MTDISAPRLAALLRHASGAYLDLSGAHPEDAQHYARCADKCIAAADELMKPREVTERQSVCTDYINDEPDNWGP